MTDASRSQLGFPAYRSARIRLFPKLWNPNAVRLMRLIRLLRASVGPLVTLEKCQLVIWAHQRLMVRPSWLISGGQESSPGSSASWRVYCRPRTGLSMS